MLRQRLGGWEGRQNVLDYFSPTHLFSYLLFWFLFPQIPIAAFVWCDLAQELHLCWNSGFLYWLSHGSYFVHFSEATWRTNTHTDTHTHQIWNSSTYSSVTLTLPCCPLIVRLTFSCWSSPNKATESLQLLSAFSRILTLFSGFSFSDTFLFFSFFFQIHALPF